MNSTSTVVGRIVIPHGAFTLADTQLEQLFVCAQRNEGAEGMAILGESGTGKTTLLERFIARHKPYRNDDGMEVPVLFASVPLGDHPKAATSMTTGSDSSKPAIEVITGFSRSSSADHSKPANEVITGFLPEVTLPEQGGKRPSGASEAYREMIELGLSRGRNAMGIWQDLVDGHGFRSSYQSVQRFVRKLRGAASPEARVIIETRLGEECQVDYGTGPMVRDPDTG
jgi:hypothetical protein